MAQKKSVNTTKSIKKDKPNDRQIDDIAIKTGKALRKRGRVRVAIPKSGGEKQIECGINGYNYVIRRGETVDIPVAVYDLLKTAKIV